MDGRTGKLAVTAAIVGLIVAASIVMEMGGQSNTRPAVVVATADKVANEKLSAELRRCNQLGPNDKPDQACLDSWAEVRRQFLGERP